jgi:nitrite reductase (NADH) small subunit
VSHWTAVGRVEDIPALGARVVRTAAGNIAVFRAEDDQIFALDDKCPHKGGPLSQGIVHGKRVTCPLHDFRIELKEGTAVAPDQGCVRTYPVRLAEGVIEIDLQAATAPLAAAE